MDEFLPVTVLVPVNKVGALYASLAGIMGASVAAAVAASPAPSKATAAPSSDKPAAAATADTAADHAPVSAAGTEAAGDVETDAHGWPWSEDMHASTKTKTKEGLWRMKVGVSRPEPKPGFPKDSAETGGTGTATNGAAAQAGGTAAGGNAGPATTADDDDEFAAFRAAAEAAPAGGTVPERKWTDADLGALCNQAAVKLGDPAPVKEIIGQFVPEGATPHSRNIPADKRAEFAKAIETKADITFEG